MLEIHQREDTKGYENLISGIEYPIIIEAVTGNKVDGFCIYSVANGEVFIHELSYNDDIYLCDGIIRTALFKVSFLGINKARFAAKIKDAAKKLHLCDDEGVLSSIESVMSGCEGCKK